MRTARFIATFVVMLSAATLAVGQNSTRWHNTKVNNQLINDRWAGLAEQYGKYLPLKKAAIFDIGYPRSAAEFENLDGYALLLVSALSQTKEELPVSRVYVTVDGKDIDLVQVHSVLTTGAGLNDAVTRGFGAYRMDAIYAFPVWLRFETSELRLQYATDKEPVSMSKFTSSVSPLVAGLPRRKPKGKSYPAGPVEQFMRREYPGYFENGLDGE
ncbi:MAG TPA: hypothetical protein VL501_03240 [Pyrinomonadaceae bacterium]|nr:hypothetical protein [Pyrinomonadaceae bacterium]